MKSVRFRLFCSKNVEWRMTPFDKKYNSFGKVIIKSI